jgi:hypothetical protein
MSCKGLHCGGCRSSSGNHHSAGWLLLVAVAVALVLVKPAEHAAHTAEHVITGIITISIDIMIGLAIAVPTVALTAGAVKLHRIIAAKHQASIANRVVTLHAVVTDLPEPLPRAASALAAAPALSPVPIDSCRRT